MRPGTLVVVWQLNGKALLTTTRSEPDRSFIPGVVEVNGLAGAYDLSRVRPVSIHLCAHGLVDLEGQR